MISKKDSSVWLQTYKLRQENLIKKFRRFGFNLDNLKIFEINGVTAGASAMPDLGALILSEETMVGGRQVNEVSIG